MECENILKYKNKIIEKDLINKFRMPLVYIKVKYQSINRNKDITSNIIETIDDIVSDIFSLYIYFKMYRLTEEGPVLIFMINSKAREIKRTTIEIEDKHILGKCITIDVYNKNGIKLNRSDLGCMYRKCGICEGNDEECVKKNNHSEEEIMRYISEKYMDFMKNFR